MIATNPILPTQEGADYDVMQLRRALDLISEIACHLERSLAIPIKVVVDDYCEHYFCCLIEKPLASIEPSDEIPSRPCVWISTMDNYVQFAFYLPDERVVRWLCPPGGDAARLKLACNITTDWLLGRISDDVVRAVAASTRGD